MRALTIRQPYAWAIATGRKPVENRPRPLSYRGDIAIHAAAAWYPGAQYDQRVQESWRYWFGTDRPDAADMGPYLFRHVLAVADLYDCHAPRPGCCASVWAEPDAGAHLMLRNVRRLERHVPARGSLVLWTLPADVDRAVREQLPHAPVSP